MVPSDLGKLPIPNHNWLPNKRAIDLSTPELKVMAVVRG